MQGPLPDPALATCGLGDPELLGAWVPFFEKRTVSHLPECLWFKRHWSVGCDASSCLPVRKGRANVQQTDSLHELTLHQTQTHDKG